MAVVAGIFLDGVQIHPAQAVLGAIGMTTAVVERELGHRRVGRLYLPVVHGQIGGGIGRFDIAEIAVGVVGRTASGHRIGGRHFFFCSKRTARRSQNQLSRISRVVVSRSARRSSCGPVRGSSWRKK
ncbi:hypothetical protein GCM10011588_14530 [Nocardia jinanensis]|uniref:Uncharacterized protein n=1 Tax=Nocardia jinanensis TaxID=382504 RepID=A0A917VN56_9NOCA|nr:hypothetical protein GCM10011588_14530 [Nocardia jinanensis]